MKAQHFALLCLGILLSMPSAFAQLSMNPGVPDQMQQGHLAPYIGSAGAAFPCQFVPYEAYFSPMPSSTMLIMKIGPCSVISNLYGSYTLQAPIHIQAIHCWMGTSANARFEPISNIQIWVQDAGGTWHMMFDELCEYDKHQDIVGNTDKIWTFPLGIDIPKNAVVNIYSYMGGLIFCGADFFHIEGPSAANGSLSQPTNGVDPGTSWDHCAVETQWRIVGTGK